MAVQKELWLPIIEENLFAAWDKLTMLGTDDNIYVNSGNGRAQKVYVPQAGAAGTLEVNPSVFPLSVSERTDTTLDYTLDHLVMPPIRLGNYDTSLLTYPKMQSILRDHMGTLGEAQLYKSFINWYIGKQTGKYVLTTGSAVDSEATGSTDSVKGMKIAEVIKAAKILDTQNIPDDGQRYMVLPAAMFYELLTDIVSTVSNISIIEKDGMVMLNQPYYGFNIVKFPQVLNVANTTYAVRAYGHAGAATDRQAGLAFHKSAVSVAKGDFNVFTDEGSSIYLGDVVSAEAYIGGSYRRSDYKGVVPIIQVDA